MQISFSAMAITLLVLNVMSCASSNLVQSKKNRDVATVQLVSDCNVVNLSSTTAASEKKQINLNELSLDANNSLCRELQGLQISLNSCMDYSTGEADFALIPSYKVKVFAYASGYNDSSGLKIHVIRKSNSQIVAQSLGSSEALESSNGDLVNTSVSVSFNSTDSSPVQYQVMCEGPLGY